MCAIEATRGLPVATKTISIDMGAYRRLVSVRRGNESLSQIIKRAVRRPFDVEAYLAAVDTGPLSDETVVAVEAQVDARRSENRREG